MAGLFLEPEVMRSETPNGRVKFNVDGCFPQPSPRDGRASVVSGALVVFLFPAWASGYEVYFLAFS